MEKGVHRQLDNHLSIYICINNIQPAKTRESLNLYYTIYLHLQHMYLQLHSVPFSTLSSIL